ncbi:MAG: tetratricopeptide repeat protein [Chitinispirillaceae bacterium]
MSTYDQFKSLMRERKYQEAIDLAEREAHKSSPPNGFWLNQQALALTRTGDCTTAVQVCDKALTLQPDNPFSLIFRSDALLKLDDVKGALTGFEEALRNPRVAERARRGVLHCLAELKEWERMRSVLASWDVPDQRIYPYKVKALMGLGRNEEAMEVCDKWLKESPDNKMALWHMVELEVARDGLESVRVRYEKLAKIPSRPPVYGEIHASLCKRAGKMDKALGQYDKLQAKTTDPSIMRRKAFALAKSGRELEAIPMLEEMLRAQPDDFYLHSSYQGACRRSKNLERAWRFYHELHAMHPDNKALFGRIRRVKKDLERCEEKKSESEI